MSAVQHTGSLINWVLKLKTKSSVMCLLWPSLAQRLEVRGNIHISCWSTTLKYYRLQRMWHYFYQYHRASSGRGGDTNLSSFSTYQSWPLFKTPHWLWLQCLCCKDKVSLSVPLKIRQIEIILKCVLSVLWLDVLTLSCLLSCCCGLAWSWCYSYYSKL